MCYTLLLEALGQGTMDAKELANEVTQHKREVVFRRIFAALQRVQGGYPDICGLL